MEDYKKYIYQAWADHNTQMFPKPTEANIAEASKRYGVQLIAPYFPNNKEAHILDIGCGWGLFLKACKDMGYCNLSGVEATRACVDFIKGQFGIQAVAGEITDYLLSLQDASQDVIVAIDVLEHFKKSEIVNLLSLIRKKLKKGGMLLLQVPNGGSVSGMYIFNSDLTHEIAFTDILLGEVYRMAGFSRMAIIKNPGHTAVSNIVAPLRKFFAKLLGFYNEHLFTTNLVAIFYND